MPGEVLGRRPAQRAPARAVVRSRSRAVPPGVRAAAERRIRARVPDDWAGFLARHSRSFRFASRFAPAAERARIAGVYAWCRVTDDLVDEPDAGIPDPRPLLDAWESLSRRAYAGETTGIRLVDHVMGEMAAADVPFGYAAELLRGMRMDLRSELYGTVPALRVYTYRVASVVGLWLTELYGVHDPWALRRAEALGHAMQLTNILRDVGEDLARGRVYLPLDLLQSHGLAVSDLVAMWRGERPIGDGYRALLETLMTRADDDYDAAIAAIPVLPGFFRAPVAIAADVYRGIHHAIRRNGYDNLSRRAYTSGPAKAVAATGTLWRLWRSHRGPVAERGPS